MKVQARKTVGCFSPISLGHDPIRSVYIEIFGWGFEIALARKMRD